MGRNKRYADRANRVKEILESFGVDKDRNYKPSEFVISKNNNILSLDGTFSSNEVAKQVLNFLKINSIQNIKIVENSEISKDLLREISELTELLKDNFENGAKLSFDGNILILEGELKDNSHKNLITTVISKNREQMENDAGTYVAIPGRVDVCQRACARDCPWNANR